LGEVLDVLLIFDGDFGTHRDFSGVFNIAFDLFREDVRHVFGLVFGLDTHLEHSLGVEEVVLDDFGELWEVPAVPFLQAHHVVVEFFV
jgi:hypothetical protein